VFLVKVSYKESIGVRGDRIAPTIGDLARVRDFKGLKDLIHKPKTTMILDHAPHAVEILKFGGLNYAEFKNFVYTVEDLFFELSSSRANKYASYTKDELNIDVQDEYCADIDRGINCPKFTGLLHPSSNRSEWSGYCFRLVCVCV